MDVATDVGAVNDAAVDALSDATPPPTALEMMEFQSFLTDVRAQLAQSHTPGASVAVVLHGRLAFAAGVGVSDTNTNAPVTTSTRFRAASMSKMVLAATAMSLVRDGRLDVHLPITHYLPWFQLRPGFDASGITLEHLLTHTSGFPADTISQCAVGTSGPRQTFFTNSPQPLWAPPGLVLNYSNTGFALAAEVLTAAAGVTDDGFEEMVNDRIFTPAGMTTATYDPAVAEAGDFAVGNNLDASGNVTSSVYPSDFDCPLLRPPGGVLATATDYAHLAEVLLAHGGNVLDPAGVDAMESPHASLRTFDTQSYAYGLMHQYYPYPDHASVWHSGLLSGFASEMWMVPDLGFAVVVLVNARGPQDVPDAIVSAALGHFISEARHGAPLTTDPSQWVGYAGTYSDPFATLGANVTVTLNTPDGGAASLMINLPNSFDSSGHHVPVSGALTQYAGDTWVFPDHNLGTFFPNDAGVTTYLVTRRGVATR
jgi:CubicO group peptidase (beta-lactamase class C family)